MIYCTHHRCSIKCPNWSSPWYCWLSNSWFMRSHEGCQPFIALPLPKYLELNFSFDDFDIDC